MAVRIQPSLHCLELPEDNLSSVCDYLSVQDRHTGFASVCKAFKDIAEIFEDKDRVDLVKKVAIRYSTGRINMTKALGGPESLYNLPRLPDLHWTNYNRFKNYRRLFSLMDASNIKLARFKESTFHVFNIVDYSIIARVTDLSVIENSFVSSKKFIIWNSDSMWIYNLGNNEGFSFQSIPPEEADYLNRLDSNQNCGSHRRHESEEGPRTTLVGGFLGFCKHPTSTVFLA